MASVDLSDDAPDPAAVLAAFALPGDAVEMVPTSGAWSNRVYRLATDRGDFAVKELRNPWADPGWLEWLDAAWRFEQTPFAAGISMPEPIPNPSDGSCLAWVFQRRGSARVPVRVHRWVDGTVPDPGPATVDLARWAGGVLATLHGLGIQATDRGVFPVTNTDTADRWSELIQAARKAGASWAGALQIVLPAVRRIADLARSAGHRPAEEVMTHGDFDQKNLLLTSTGPLLCDWDVAAPLVPRRELADVAMSLAGWRSADVAREVVQGYGEYGGDDTHIRPNDLGQTMMIGLDWIAFNVERAIGLRRAALAETALSHMLVPGLLAELPIKVQAALEVHTFLDARR